MSQKMSWEEMKRAFPDEWVAITNREGDLEQPYGDIIGEVLCHHADEKVFTKQLKETAKGQLLETRYTGKILPENPIGLLLWPTFLTNS